MTSDIMKDCWSHSPRFFIFPGRLSWIRNKPATMPYMKPTNAPLVPLKNPNKTVKPETIGQNQNLALL